MSKQSMIDRFIKFVYVDDENSDDYRESAEPLTISPIQILLVILVTGIFIGWIISYPFKVSNVRKEFMISDYLDKEIEKNYFVQQGISNQDFNKGLDYWITSDGGKLFPESESEAAVCTQDFHSGPQCLRIKCLYPASRYYYSKQPDIKKIDNPYGIDQTCQWLGVLPGSIVKVNLWHKGDTVRIALNGLDGNGVWKNLDHIAGRSPDEWKEISFETLIPEDGRAVMLEITLNQAEGEPLPVVFIDDVNVEVGLNKPEVKND